MANQFYPCHPNGVSSSPQSWGNCYSSHPSTSVPHSPGNAPFSPSWNEGEDVFLAPSVEAKLQEICIKQRQERADTNARRCLASIGEQASLDVLEKISPCTIRTTLSRFILYMVKKYYPQQHSTSGSFSHSPQRYFSSPSSSCSSSNFTPRNVPSPSNAGDETFESKMSKPDILSPQSSARSFSHHPRILEFEERANALGVSYQLSALSELEFRKFFLILNYIGRNKLEDVVTPEAANDILYVGNQSMAAFESYMWTKFSHLCEDHERLRYIDWDSGRTHIYNCNVDSNEEYTFKGPYLISARTHLQQALGDENVLIVKFWDDAPTNARKIIENGLLVGLRRYRFFVFKDEGKEKKSNPKDGRATTSVKCYFVRMETLGHAQESFILHGKTVHDARCLFMHVHMVSSMAKYMARFSLILSKTVKLPIDLGPLSDVKILEIEDTYCRDEFGSIILDEDGAPLIQTDGTGFISEDLAKKCPKNFYKVKHLNDANSERLINGGKFGEEEYQNMEPPLIMQCRIYTKGRAVKGTLLVNRRLPESTIHIRPSMIKVGTDPELPCTQIFDSLEIVAISKKPKKAHLSKTLIALLSYGGVPREYFLDILKSALEETQRIYSDEILALKAACNYEDLDYGSIAKRTADPTEKGVLNRDEVCVILDYGQIVGEVLVYRNPGLHFGDIHKLNAVYVKEIDEIVGNAKYAIFFSTKGQRSVASEIANGDFDGDVYWVSLNCQLIENFGASSPWERFYSTPKPLMRKPNEISPEELEHTLFQMFLETRRPSYSMSTAADSWLALMDRLLVLGDNCESEMEAIMVKMLELIDLYYDALDAPKSGKKVNIPKDLKVYKLPHFMGKQRDAYHSTSVLGEIYDTVVSFETKAPPPVEITTLPCFDIKVPDECLRSWRKRYNEYRAEMTEALSSKGESQNDLANEVIKKYKRLLYGADELEESEKSMKDIYDNALAIYHVTYDHAMLFKDAKKCGFAWKVAGSALCKLHAELQAKENNGKAMIVSPVMLQKILHLKV
ncbi:probable RNA-dependent RNA polymerase 5 isoform X3 [Ipomoea triloba]|uniref:probable RNA-dependent RNA polymerase 5 isoform X3 n=1 Tax=Ipomoea triloba TaxID=35885 RepID=UPI00125D8AA9|nr:probable RNA-dependent RNA polymerase 5 isoform X3 [Ipomoea triloba]